MLPFCTLARPKVVCNTLNEKASNPLSSLSSAHRSLAVWFLLLLPRIILRMWMCLTFIPPIWIYISCREIPTEEFSASKKIYVSKGSKFEENIVDSPIIGDLATCNLASCNYWLLATTGRKWLLTNHRFDDFHSCSNQRFDCNYRSSFVTLGKMVCLRKMLS